MDRLNEEAGDESSKNYTGISTFLEAPELWGKRTLHIREHI